VLSWAGGGIGSGRMADLGAPLGPVLLWSLGSFALGGLVGGLVGTWWTRRHELAEAEPGVLPSWRGRARRDPVVSIYGAPRLGERLKVRLSGRRSVPAQRSEPDTDPDSETGDDRLDDEEHTVTVHLDEG